MELKLWEWLHRVWFRLRQFAAWLSPQFRLEYQGPKTTQILNFVEHSKAFTLTGQAVNPFGITTEPRP